MALVYLLLFDKAGVPVNGDVPIDAVPLVTPSTTVPGEVVLPMGETRDYINGIAWAISTTPTVLTLNTDGATAFVVGEFET